MNCCDEHAALLLGLLRDRQRVDVAEGPHAQVPHRELGGAHEAPARGPCRDERDRDEHDRGRAPRVDERRLERRVEPVGEDRLDQDRRDQRGHGHAERDDHREPQAAAQLRAGGEPAAQDPERPLELFGDLDRVVGVDGHQRSPRS
jgi:hypothetical protein